jgi:hypothetical protein
MSTVKRHLLEEAGDRHLYVSISRPSSSYRKVEIDKLQKKLTDIQTGREILDIREKQIKDELHTLEYVDEVLI